MLHAIATDFLEIPEVEVAVVHDARLPFAPLASGGCARSVASREEAEDAFLQQAAVADFVLIIAPEFEGHLLRKTWAIERLGIKLLSPNSEFIAITSDKWRTYQYFRANDVRTPETWLLDRQNPQLPDEPFPLVVKPVDGCGSQGVQLLSSEKDEIDWSEISGDAIVQPYCSGTPVSKAYIKRESWYWSLPTCRQILCAKSRFQYLGGDTNIPAHLASRAMHLASHPRVFNSVGYFGVDLILGDAEDGSQDYVIEINPRLTTSYIGLRALSRTNLAQAMLDVAEGREPQLAWKPGYVRWSADGSVEYFES